MKQSTCNARAAPVRRGAGAAKRWLAPRRRSRPGAARAGCPKARRASRPARFSSARTRCAISDLLTLCPQWHDIFVTRLARLRDRRPAPRILDCGANIGLASLFFKRALSGGAHHRVRSRSRRSRRCSRRTCARNGAGDVEVVAAAVWTSAGEMTFSADGADSGAVASLAGAPGAAAITRADRPARRRARARARSICSSWTSKAPRPTC